ncbi:hypothetical protein RY27_08750, partial [Litorilinea aerophila]
KQHPVFIPGQPPSQIHPPTVCSGAARYPATFEPCDQEPPLSEPGARQQVKCWLYAEERQPVPLYATPT